jgi:hypothetical protein
VPVARCCRGTPTGSRRAGLEGHTRAVQACTFSPDGALALSASSDDTLRLWGWPPAPASPCSRGTVKPIYGDDRLAIFVLPRGAREARLLSLAQSPTEARPWLDDRRRLGVRVKRIVLRGTDELREIPVDHPDLSRGWWAVERDGQVMSRWTDGEAVLLLPAMRGHVMLEIHLAGSMTYVVDAACESGTGWRAAA